MSAAPEAAYGGEPRALFAYEVRRQGRRVALLRGVAAAGGGVVVQAEVTPQNGNGTGETIRRPFPFPTPEHARRFVDEALVVFEYLGCDIAA